jgi:cytochrome P450 family 138
MATTLAQPIRPLPPRPVPGPSPTGSPTPRFFVGWFSLLESCQRRYGDVFRLHLPLYGRVVVIAAPDAIRTVFHDRNATTVSSRRAAILENLVDPGSLPLLDGERHVRRRRLLLPALHGKQLDAYE